MFKGLFGDLEKNSTDNNRSVINPKFSLSKDTCTVGIYISDTSRVILMEFGAGHTRQMLRYEGDIALVPEANEQPLLWDWTLFATNNWRNKIGEFTRLRSSARSIIDFQLTSEEFKAFKAALDKRPTTGSKNPFDQSIYAAATAIGKTIYLDDIPDDFCCIS